MSVQKAVKFTKSQLSSCGVYAITCIPEDKMYIGSSNNIFARWKSHVAELNRGVHTNYHLQKAWKTYGKSNFNFSVLEFCSIDKKFDIEQKYIDQYQACNREFGYNICELAAVPPLSPESRQRQSESLKKNTEFIENNREFLKKLHSDPVQQKALVESVLNSDKVKETLRKMNESDEHKAQVQRLLHQVHSDERIQKIVKGLAQENMKSDSWKAKHNCKEIAQLSLSGELIQVFPSLCACSSAGFCREVITKMVRHQTKRTEYKGYKWMYLYEYSQTK